MLYCKAKSENEDYRKESTEKRLRSSPTNLQPKMVLRVNDYGWKCAWLNGEGVIASPFPHFRPALRKVEIKSSITFWSFAGSLLAKDSTENLGSILRTFKASARASSSLPARIKEAVSPIWVGNWLGSFLRILFWSAIASSYCPVK